MIRLRLIAAGLLLAIVAAACAGGAAEATGTPSDAGDPATSGAPPGGSAEPAATDETTQAEPPADLSGVDWSTVDLTTIDWATIDLRQVDWRVINDNPTAENLTDEHVALIQSRVSPGSATLTIGDVVYQFDRFDCASGHENTESETFSFTTNSFGEFDGVRTQMQFTVEDPTSSGQTEGEGVRHRIDFDDIGDFENPAISWSMGEAGSVSIDGYEVFASGTFDDGLTELVTEDIAGTLEASCSDMSRF